MEYKRLIFSSLAMIVLMSSFVVAIKGLSPDDFEDREILRIDGMYINDVKQESNINLDVWIDSYHLDENMKRVYHVDSKIKGNVNRTLRFYYKQQPDYINQINHKGHYVYTYYPHEWLWESHCDIKSPVPKCDGGYLTFESFDIDQGIGSTLYPVGSGGSVFYSDGEFYGNFNSDANDRLIISDSNELSPNTTGEFTVSFWINTSGLFSGITSSGYRNVFAKGASSPHYEWWFRLYNQTATYPNRLTYTISSTNAGSTCNSYVNLDPNVWNHVVAIVDSEGSRMYMNGVLSNRNSTTCLGVFSAWDNKDHDVTTYGNSVAYSFDGYYDEIRIYNQSISEQDIISINNSGRTSNTSIDSSGLVLWINFDNSSVYDRSVFNQSVIFYNMTFAGDKYFDDMIENRDYNLANGIFHPFYSSYYNMSYDIYTYYEDAESSYSEPSSFFFIDLTERHNLYLLILFFGVAITLLFFKQKMISSLMLLIGGFLLLASGVHILIVLVPFLSAIIVGGMLYGVTAWNKDS